MEATSKHAPGALPSETWFRTIVETAHEGVWMIGPDGVTTYVNPQMAAMLGYEPGEMLGRNAFDFVFPEDRPQGEAEFSSRQASDGGKQIEFRYRRKDGSAVWTLASTSSIQDGQGQVVGILGLFSDITSRKAAEEALRASELFHRQMIDSLPTLVWTTRPDGYCDYLSKQWVRYTGVPEERHWGEGWLEAIHPEDRERVTAAWREATAGRSSYNLEYRLRRHDDTYHWFKTRGHPIQDEQGQIVRWFGTSTEIEDQKRTEAELQVAKDAAEAASRAKDKFLAVLSHELRTPLTPVLTVTQMLETDPSLSPEMHAAVRMIRRNVELETRLIDDLLDLTRINRGKLELHLSAIDLHDKVRHIVSICDSDIRAKPLELVTRLDAVRHWIQADPARVQQVLWNLVKNAVKFTPAGGTITISTADTDCGGVVVEVGDTGVGIDPEMLPRIFEPFEQGGREVTRLFGGLGLGLAITKSLVELHGGTLTAASEGRDRGAVFTIRLPASSVAGLDSPDGGLPAEPAERSPSALRVLLVDDHGDTLAAMAQLVRMFGYTVRTADSVAAALQAAEAEHFDMVVSDIGLPDGSGLDLMRQLLAKRPIRGIALSGYGMEEDLRRSREAGFLQHLTKPINLAQLEEALAKAAALEVEA